MQGKSAGPCAHLKFKDAYICDLSGFNCSRQFYCRKEHRFRLRECEKCPNFKKVEDLPESKK